MHPLSLDFISAVEASPPELIEIAAANGLEFVSLPVKPALGRPDWGLIGDTPMRRETKARSCDLGVQVDVFESFYLTADTVIENLRPPFESGAWLGARRVAMVIQDDEPARAEAHIHEFCDLAREHGLTVLLEYTPRMSQRNLREAHGLLRRVSRPELRLECDALHTFRSGGSVEEIASVSPTYIGRAQLSDAPLVEPPEGGFHEAAKERLIPGDGELPLAAFVRALPPDLVIGLEVPQQRLTLLGVGAAERVRRIASGARRVLEEAAREVC